MIKSFKELRETKSKKKQEAKITDYMSEEKFKELLNNREAMSTQNLLAVKIMPDMEVRLKWDQLGYVNYKITKNDDGNYELTPVHPKTNNKLELPVILLTEGKVVELPNEQEVLEVSTEPADLKIEKEDKSSFEEFKVFYKGQIDDKCLEDYGTIEDEKLWEDAAKELFMASEDYMPKEKDKAEKIEESKLEEAPRLNKELIAKMEDPNNFKDLYYFSTHIDDIEKVIDNCEDKAKCKKYKEVLKAARAFASGRTKTESASDRYQVREFEGPGAKFGVYDTKEDKFVQKGSKYVMVAACDDLNKTGKVTESSIIKNTLKEMLSKKEEKIEDGNSIFELKFDCSNEDVFGIGYELENSLSDVLYKVADKVKSGVLDSSILDINGNKIGSYGIGYEGVESGLSESKKIEESVKEDLIKLKEDGKGLYDYVANNYYRMSQEELKELALDAIYVADNDNQIINEYVDRMDESFEDDLNKAKEDSKRKGLYCEADNNLPNFTRILDNYDWEIDILTKEDLGSDYYYRTLCTTVNDAERFNYHSDYWGDADTYQQDNIDLMEQVEPYVGKEVLVDFDDDGEVHQVVYKILGIVIDKQYNSLSHTDILAELVREIKNENKNKKTEDHQLYYDDIQGMPTSERHDLWKQYHEEDFEDSEEGNNKFWDWAEEEFPVKELNESIEDIVEPEVTVTDGDKDINSVMVIYVSNQTFMKYYNLAKPITVEDIKSIKLKIKNHEMYVTDIAEKLGATEVNSKKELIPNTYIMKIKENDIEDLEEDKKDRCIMCDTDNLDGCFVVKSNSICKDCGKKYSLDEIENKISNKEVKTESQVSEYTLQELNKVINDKGNDFKIQISGSEDKTNWLNIDKEDLEAICKALQSKKAE